MAAELVGVREEIAFERGGARVQVADHRRVARCIQKPGSRKNPQLLCRCRDIEHVLTFGHHQFVIVNISARDTVEDLAWTGGALEAVLARLQNMAAPGEARQQKIPA